MSVNVRAVADFACHTGESPWWNPFDSCVYWIDIPAGRLLRFDPASGASGVVYEGEAIGGLVLREDGQWILLGEEGRVSILGLSGRPETIRTGIAEHAGTRFNDAIADARGRVISGTMPQPGGGASLNLIDLDGSVKVLHDRLEQSNGMGFSSDGKRLYHVDTQQRVVRRFDYDCEVPALSNEIVLMSFEDLVPDGLVVDSEECLWIAFYHGSCIARYSPEGKELQRIDLPTPKVTSMCFAGPTLEDLYITTAGGGETPLAGALFHARPEVKGMRPFLGATKR